MAKSCIRCRHPKSFHGNRPGQFCGGLGCINSLEGCPGYLASIDELTLDAALVAELAGRDRRWVIANAKLLGGVRVGRSWRFDPAGVRSRLPDLVGKTSGLREMLDLPG